MTQTALDMPDGLRPPFYTITWRYGTKEQREFDELEEALAFLRGGEEDGEHSTEECGDQDGWLWRRDGSAFEAHERAPSRPSMYFFYEDDD